MAEYTIPSTYNFVPLSKHVFFPGWSEKVSMDVPFSDGISGTLEIKVTAKSPIYIRNGGSHPEDLEARRNDPSYSDFFRVTPEGPYAIPGTSLKGMLRGVIEIATFSKIAGSRGQTSRVSEHRYAIRDLYNRDYTSKITESVGNGYRPKVNGAWLEASGDGEWQLTLCDFARVEQEDLENHFKLGRGALGRRGPATDKYRNFQPFTKVVFECGAETSHRHSRMNLVYKKVGKLGSGTKEGTVVLTGQPSARDGRPGKKHLEFIFFDEKPEAIPVPAEVKKNFEFTHSELGENRKPNNEWAFWKKYLDQGKKIPVFVLMEGGNIHSIGLAMMYRFPYANSILETIAHTSEDHLDGGRLDFGETLFGRAEDTDSLRGRVSVETLIADGSPSVQGLVTTILGAPKPTFYPNYVKQRANADGYVSGERYTTYMDGSAEIRGWKRYIARKNGETAPIHPEENQERVSTFFKPLPEGTAFSGTIRLHNVKPEELGAVVWALTWGGNPALRHGLGMGKPYGFGAVTVSITGSSLKWCNPAKSGVPETGECMKLFIETMNKWYGDIAKGQTWEKSEEISALRALADPNSAWEHEIRYPVIGRNLNENEFARSKNKDKNDGKVLSLLPPVPAKPRKAPPPPKPVQEPKKQTNTDKFIADLDAGGISVGNIPKRLKNYKLTPANVTPEEKRLIHDKLQRYIKEKNNPEAKRILSEWK